MDSGWPRAPLASEGQSVQAPLMRLATVRARVLVQHPDSFAFLQELPQQLAGSIQANADVGFGDARDGCNLALGHFFERQSDDLPVGQREAMNGLAEALVLLLMSETGLRTGACIADRGIRVDGRSWRAVPP